MAIYTRFGSPVEVVDASLDSHDQLWLKVKLTGYRGDIVENEYHVSELRADGGLSEIMQLDCVSHLFSSQNS